MRYKSLQLTRLLGAAILVGALLPSPAHGQCEVTQVVSPSGPGGNAFVASSVSGDVLVVGDTLAFASLGAAYVFRRGPDGPADWNLEATLMAPVGDNGDQFAAITAVSGDVIVIGASTAAAPEFNSGAAYVYRYDPKAMQWNIDATLTASDGDLSDGFGYFVAVDNDVILVSAWEDENHGVFASGSAYVFRFDGSEWIQEAKLYDPNAEELDLFGRSVSISGDIALIGAVGNDDAGSGTGAAFIFRHDSENPGNWILEQQLQAFDAQWQAWFGDQVVVRGNLALIGAPQDNSQTGAAYLMRFDKQKKQWVHEAKLVASNPVGPFPLMGSSIAMSMDQNIALIGAPLDDEAGNEAGAAHLFRKDGEEWTEIAKLIASDSNSNGNFGTTVGLTGDIAISAALNGSSNPGKVYVFAGAAGTDCNQNGQPDACDIFKNRTLDGNGNGIPDSCEPPPCPWDLDKNGSVGTTDLLELFAQWGTDGPADFDASGAVGTADLLIMFANWGSCG